MQQKSEKGLDEINKKSSAKGKETVSYLENQNTHQVDELQHKRIPSLMALISQTPDYDLTRAYLVAYIEYVIHFIKYEQLNNTPSLEVEHLCAIINRYLQENRKLEEYKGYINSITRLILAATVNGPDNVDLYIPFEEVLDKNPKYRYGFWLTTIKIEFYCNQLRGLEQSINPREKRGEYIVNKLVSSIKYAMEHSSVIFSSHYELDGTKILELIRGCTNLNLFDKYKEDILFIIYVYLTTNFYSTISKNDSVPDLLSIFKMGQILFEQKEYNLLKNIIKKYSHSANKHRCRSFECPCLDKQKLIALIYPLKFADEVPDKLKDICQTPVYKDVTELFIPSNSLLDWEKYFVIGYGATLLITIDLYSSSIIKNYSAKELIVHFSKIAATTPQPTIPNKSFSYFDLINKNKKTLILNLLKKIDEQELKSLDKETKMNLLVLNKWCDNYYLSFDFFNLLPSLNKEGQLELINYYKTNFKIDKMKGSRLILFDFLLSAYPLEASTKVSPSAEEKIAMPAGLYMQGVVNEAKISTSFGWGLLQIDDDPMTLSFVELEPLLKSRNAIILANNELFYADLNLGKVRKLKVNEANKQDASKLSSKCAYDYQLADEEACKLIISLTGIVPPFKGFYQLFQKTNQRLLEQAGVQNTVDYNEFMLVNAVKLLNLYEFMREDLFLFMKKMISPSPQKLKRYFGNLVLIPSDYFQILQLVHKKFNNEVVKGESRSYEVLLILIGQLEIILAEIHKSNIVTNFSKEDFIKQLASITEKALVMNELTELVTKEISSLYRLLLDLPENTELDLSKFEKDPLLLSRLLTARKAMKENQLNSVFDKLIEYDLRTDVQFFNFANDTNQEHPIGKKLSLHNQKIEKDLLAANINTKLALNYPQVKVFSFGDKAEIDLPLLANALYADIKNLEHLLIPQTSIKFFEENGLNRKIRESIDHIKKQVEKKSGIIQIKAILNGVLDKHFNFIERHLRTVSRQEVSNELQEHGKHFLDHRDQLIKAQGPNKVQSRKKGERKKDFYVVQWDKNQLETFLLGDYLSCCLAPDGGQFQAMVQRRMDSAMMIHVVFDKELNQPVCGNWLFFARDKKNPQDIYVVANFFEIRASYGLKKKLSKKLVDELLTFTGQYAEKIGAKGFIMRPLTYGLIPDFEGAYPTLKMKIEKVGGFFDPSVNKNQSAAPESYYLQALDRNEFYVYKPNVCENQLEINVSSPTI